jgi:bla regulator protein BlaR1
MIDLLESLLSAEFIRAFALTLFHSLWQGALFAMVTAGIILMLRKYRPALRYAVLYTLFVLIPVFFIATFIIVYNPGSEAGSSTSIYTSNTLQAEEGQAVDGVAVSGNDPARALYLSVIGFFENNARSFVMIWLAGFLSFMFTG